MNADLLALQVLPVRKVRPALKVHLAWRALPDHQVCLDLRAL